jgi:hypothetical protein
MKHEQTIRRLIAELHQPWMNDADKSEFDAMMIEKFGDKLDADIEAGIANGYTIDQQAEIVRNIFKELSK